MTERMKEMVLGALIAALFALGIGWAALSTGVETVREKREPGLFTERSLFCPGEPEGVRSAARLAVGALGSDEVRVELEPQDDEPRDVLGDSAVFLDQQNSIPTNVVGYGGPVGAATSQVFATPESGAGSSTCSLRASREWYMPFGSSARGSNELLYLYNPFPDEAVVRVVFYDENGPISKANLADIAVPAGETTTVKVNRFILQQDTLAAQITTLRGRIAAWKILFSESDIAKGTSIALGATKPAPIWYFPSGAVGPGLEERISLLNPNDEEAIVSVSLISDDKIMQPPELLELTLPRESALDISLPEVLPNNAEGSVSVIVQAINEVGIVAERAVWYGEGAFKGFASEIGAPLPALGWWLPPAVQDAERDSIVVLNTSDQPVTVDVAFQGPDGPVSAEGVGTLNLRPGGRARISLDGLKDPSETVAVLSADGLVVAERVAYSSSAGDVAAVMGIPIHSSSTGD